MWTKPHLLILDEPTNYLDAEALHALSYAITQFKGAVILISHHGDFLKTCCDSLWQVGNKKVTIIKKSEWDGELNAHATQQFGDVEDEEGEAAAKEQTNDEGGDTAEKELEVDTSDTATDGPSSSSSSASPASDANGKAKKLKWKGKGPKPKK